MNPGDQSSQLPEVLRGAPWRSHMARMPQSPPTMLSSEELQLLHWLTSRYYTGEGVIVDGGCFLGGSTCALASGLAENAAAGGTGKTIHSYDLFKTPAEYLDPSFSQFGLKAGQSFLDIYRGNVSPFLDRIEIHEGDLLKQSWDGGKIEILFLDCCKMAALHDHAVRLWFPQLIPGRSVLIQQDYHWWYYSWGNIMMEVFKDHFVVLDDMPHATRVYLCVRAISEDDAARRTYARLSGEERLRYMEEALKSVSREDFKARMLVNYAMEASQLGREKLLQEILFSILAAPQADLVIPVVAELFPDQFMVPEHDSFPAADDPRMKLRRAWHKASERGRKMSFFQKLRRSIRKRLGRSPG